MQYVYFIQAGGIKGPIKIGVTDDPERRLAFLQTGNHEQLDLLAVAPGGVAFERELHARFAEWRLRGEWFAADAPGLRDVITEELHYETQLAIHDAGICLHCQRRPVVPPRARFCSEKCATRSAQRRSRDWRRESGNRP